MNNNNKNRIWKSCAAVMVVFIGFIVYAVQDQLSRNDIERKQQNEQMKADMRLTVEQADQMSREDLRAVINRLHARAESASQAVTDHSYAEINSSDSAMMADARRVSKANEIGDQWFLLMDFYEKKYNVEMTWGK
jgi:hypothetical protein